MKKILKLLSVVVLPTSITSLVVSCGSNSGLKNLPNNFGIMVNDTGDEVELKIQETFIKHRVSIYRHEYEIYLIINEQEKELEQDYIVKNKDKFLIKILDQSSAPYNHLEFVVTDSRYSLKELKVNVNRAITIARFIKKVNDNLTDLVGKIEIKVDYSIMINNILVEELLMTSLVKEGDNIYIFASQNSKFLQAEINYKLEYVKIDLATFNIELKQGTSYQKIKEILDSKMDGWEENISVLIKRNNKNYELFKDYFTLGGDEITFSAKPASQEFFNETKTYIKTVYYDRLLSNIKIPAGLTIEDLKEELGIYITNIFKKNFIEIKVESSNIKTFSNINSSELLTKEQVIEYDLVFFDNSYFKEKQSVWIYGYYGPLKFENVKSQWVSYELFFELIKEGLDKVRRPRLDPKKELLIYTYSNGVKIPIDENFDPNIHLMDDENSKFFAVFIKANPNSKYLDAKNFHSDLLFFDY